MLTSSPGFGQKTAPLLPSRLLRDCSAMTTARYRPTWDLALDPLVSCKLCLGEYPLEQMTTLAQCQCIFCTLCLKQYVELLIKEGLETAISCPDATCPKQGHLQDKEARDAGQVGLGAADSMSCGTSQGVLASVSADLAFALALSVLHSLLVFFPL